MEAFCVELAGVPIGVRCRHADTVTFLREYRTEREPAFTLEPGPADLEQAQAEADRQDEAEGREPHRRPEPQLESLALHRLLAERLPEYDVLLMHGSALCMDGAGYIFTAPSGTGKSTHAALWRQVFGQRVRMLNDDKPLLRIREDGVTVFGSPWAGKHRLSCNASAPLRAIARLERAAKNHIEPITQAEAFPILLAQAYSSRDPAVMVKILTLEKRLLNCAAFYTLFCNPEPEAARVAWQGMRVSISR